MQRLVPMTDGVTIWVAWAEKNKPFFLKNEKTSIFAGVLFATITFLDLIYSHPT